jgi:CRISPR-associated protein Cas2
VAARTCIWVFAYDVTDDNRRNRVANLLEDFSVRVQYSVFEARLTAPAARSLAGRVKRLLLPGDRLRVYAVSDRSLASCHRYGGAPLPEQQDFWLL